MTTSSTIKLNDTDVKLAALPDGRLGVALYDLNTAAGRTPTSCAYPLRLQRALGAVAKPLPKVRMEGRGRGKAMRILDLPLVTALRASFEDKELRACNREEQLALLRSCEEQLRAAQAAAQASQPKPVRKTKAKPRSPLTEAVGDALASAGLEELIRRVVREELAAHAKRGTAMTSLGFVQSGGRSVPTA